MSCEEQHDASEGGAADPSRYLPGSNSPMHSFSRRETCQIPGCAADLTSERKRYCWYKRICYKHLRAESLRVATPGGEELHRFCFQCGKLQPLQDFDGSKRSCREKLSQRRARQGAAALKTVCADSTAHGGPEAPATGTICAGSNTSGSTTPVISSTEQQILPVSSDFSLSCMGLHPGSGGGGGMTDPVLGVPAMASTLSSPCAERGSPAWAQPPVSTLPHAEAARGAAAVLAAVPGPGPYLSGVQGPGGPLTLLPPSLPRLRLSPLQQQQQDDQLLRSPSGLSGSALAATAATRSTSFGIASALCGQAAPQPAAVCSTPPQARPSDSAAVLYGVSASLAADTGFPPKPASLVLAAHDPLLPSVASLAAINTAGTSASLAAADKAAGIASLAASSPMSAGEFENMLADLLVEELTTMPCSPKTAASLDWLCASVLGPAAVPGVCCSHTAASFCGETEAPAAVDAATGHPLAGAGAGVGAAPYVSSGVGFPSPSALPISPGVCPVSGLQQLQLSCSLAACTQGSFVMGGPTGSEKHAQALVGSRPAAAGAPRGAGAGVAAPYVSSMLVTDGVSVQLSGVSAAGELGAALHPGPAAAAVAVGPEMLQPSTAPGMSRPSHAHLQRYQALLAQLDSVEENLWRLKQYMSAVAAAGAASSGHQASSAVAANTAMYLHT